MNRSESTLADREVGEQMAAPDREFSVLEVHDRRGVIVERDGLHQ